ncbi:GntG family PLP-dependent aldolase [Micromonospora sp. NPDC051296]|uniref:GntG family PLP-dependent aldolase n=1 Tax=Micromonospora sp. NPDC051296 TaxID=3155046 RepID=UPI0034306055
MIELRSDTFTLPTGRMRQAIVEAPLGDDIYGEDPTVARLEHLAAERLGKAAACLMPSGTMANLAAQMAHCPRGSKVVVGAESDIYLYEAGGASVCGGLTYAPVPNLPDGRLDQEALHAEFAIDHTDPQLALPALLCLENTQNRCGGAVLPLSYLELMRTFASEHGVRLHLDGARVFNAAVALGVPVAAIAEYADSVQFCLSKGLGAPIGSVVAGGEAFIGRVRRVRKLLGGSMRQAGIVAAAGIVALDEMVDRLAEDHAHAAQLARELADVPGVEVGPFPQTNIVMFRLTDGDVRSFLTAAAARGLSLAELGRGRIRAVTHHGVSAADVDRAAQIVSDVLATQTHRPLAGTTDSGGRSS